MRQSQGELYQFIHQFSYLKQVFSDCIPSVVSTMYSRSVHIQEDFLDLIGYYKAFSAKTHDTSLTNFLRPKIHKKLTLQR